MKKCRVSVIMPAYNVELYIQDAIESILNQTFKDFEFIIINDGSTDNTAKIIQKYAKKDKRIKFINFDENIGCSVARNTGIDKSSGEYIAFMDSDDTVDNDFYEKLYNAAKENNNADIVKARLSMVTLYGKKDIDFDFNKRIQENKYVFDHQFTTAIYRKDIITKNKIHFPEGISLGEDICFLSCMVFYSKKIIVINDTYYNYIRRQDSLDSPRLNHTQVMDSLESAQVLVDFVNSVKIEDCAYDILVKRGLKTIKYTCEKEIVPDEYFIIAKALQKIHKEIKNKSVIKEVFDEDLLKALESKETERIIIILQQRKYKIRLFGLIPVGVYYTRPKQQYFKLFNLIPLFRYKRTYKREIFVLGILVLKIK